VAKLQHSRRVTSMLLPPPNCQTAAATTAAAAAGRQSLLLCGCDDGRLCLWDVVGQLEGPVWEMAAAHKTRIRAITAVVPGEEGQ